MYSILIAEDELLARIGIKVSILESGLPLTVVGETSNGLSAYELFIQKRPDIVITDIKMPGLNGTELIHRIRNKDKDCAIIVISCIEEFDILQKAMQEKVSAYLLKATMTREEIISSLRKAIDDLGAERRLSTYTIDDLSPVQSIGELIASLINGNLSEDEVIEQLKNTGFSPDMMIVFFLRGRNLDNITQRSLEEVVALRFSGIYRTLTFMITDECLICLTSGIERNITSLLEELQRYIEKTFSLLTIIIAKTLEFKFDCLPTMLKLCFEEGKELKYFDISHPVQNNWMEMLYEHVKMLILRIEMDKGIIEIMNESDHIRYHEQMENVAHKAVGGRHAFLDALYQAMEELCRSEIHFDGDKIQMVKDAASCKEALIQAISKLCIAYSKQPYQTKKDEILKALKYIDEYFVEPLTLKEMASFVGLSPNYFSNLFAEEIGQSFISYLNGIRIEKAKQLLMQDDLLVYQVAHRVGFDDETYFCRMFKKNTGESPRNWRKLKNRMHKR